VKDLLDTSIVSEWSKPRPHGGVLAWLNSNPLSDYGIPAIAIYELQVGSERARAQHPQKSAQLDAWIERMLTFAVIVPFDGMAARETARLMHGKSLDLLEDAMIAAIAKVNGLRVATRNTKDFEQFGVPLIDPFLYRKR
jgi:predicted nucleic acid-binding protein